jgi:uncharacterized OB-fold protein
MTMSLKDRITSVEKLRSWTGQIPFRYEYTAGVAGEKFLRGLREGRILASECTNCGKKYIPPKVYCVGCYREIRRFKQAGPEGVVAALAESSVGFEGDRLVKPKTFAFIVFKGVTGGLIHFATGTGLEIGSRVVPKFRAPSKRQGTILDIERFVKV